MAKRDALKVIDQGTTGGSGGSGTVVIADNVDRVDGFHAFPTPRPGALLALNAEGQFPASVFPGANMAAGQITGHHGVQFFGPTAYLAAAVAVTDTSILSTLPLFTQADDVLISRYDGYEWVSIADGGTVEGAYWRYAVLRGQQGTAVQSFPVYSEIVLAGHPGTGGHIFIDSGGSENSPYLRVRSSEADGTFRFRAQLGKLATVPAGFRAKFPAFTDWATTWGLASENAFLSGGIHALYGDIAGDLDVSGTLTIQGPADSKMQLGETVGGWGLGVRNSAGRPVIQMLAPFVDASGNVISDVAFVLDNNGKPGIFYHQVEGTDDYRLEIGVDTLVGGNFRVGETFLVGTGDWGNTFAGIAIDSDWGLVGLAAGDTFPEDPNNGSYQVRWDKATGKLFTGGGAIGFGRQGMSLRSKDDPDLTSNIKWYDGANKTMQFGSQGYRKGSWSVGSQTEFGYIPDFAIDMSDVTGLSIRNDMAGTNNVYYAPGGSKHLFYVGGDLALEVGAHGGLKLPITLAGSEVTGYWKDTGRLGIGIDEPETLLHIAHPTLPQFRISAAADIWTQIQTTADGTTWTTTGDIVLGPGTNTIQPAIPYGVDLGSPYRRFHDVYAAQLNVETLVAQQKIATIGGRVMVAPTTQLYFDLQTGDSIIYLKHNTPVINDTLLMEGGGVIEALTVTSAGVLTPIGAYQYSVTRGVGTTSPQKWGAGAAVVITGQTGAGWIDLYSTAGLARDTTYGPTIVGNVRLSNTWNDWRERWSIGNLNGLYGYSATTWGVAFGNPLATHITIDDTNGYRLRNASTTVAQWNAAGTLTLGATGAVTITAAGAATFSGKVTAGTGNNIVILDPNDATYRLWVGNASAAAAPFSVTETGFVNATSGKIGGWTLAATSLKAGSAGTTVGLDSGGTNPAIYAGSATPASAPFRVTAAGALTATNATITGAVTATSGSFTGTVTAAAGSVGGWTLAATSLKAGSAGTTVGLDSGGTNPAIYAGSATPASAPFRVTAAGALFASSATITGTVTMTAGTISGVPVANVAGWGHATDTTKIDGGDIYTGTVTAAAIAANTITAAKIAAGTITATEIAAATITGAKLVAGTITATQLGANSVIAGKILAGSISASDLATNSVTAAKIDVTTLSAISADLGSVTAGQIVVGSTNKLWLNDAADGALAIGGATKASAPFRVTAAGALFASNATITGTITANSGTIGNWTINSTYLATATAGMAPTDYPFYAGSAYAGRATAPFSVSAAGAMTATSGAIAGFTISADKLTSGSFSIDSNNKRVTFTAGAYMQWGGGITIAIYGQPYFKGIAVFEDNVQFNIGQQVDLLGATRIDYASIYSLAGASGGLWGMFGTAPIAKQTVSGSRGGNAALASLLTALAAYGAITNSTTA